MRAVKQHENTQDRILPSPREVMIMGLFDTVELDDDVHLPEYLEGITPAEDVDWQTKSIDRPTMTTFRITADGRLLEEEWHTEAVPPEDRPYASRDDVGEDDFRYMAGSLNRVHNGWIERDDYHGRFKLTHSFEDLETLVMYQVTFTHGQLEGFERLR
ncbi:hypothetical protein GCM10008995_01830 [Halobellus salinus]|uniref:Uncharacterized protein n=2 Tax=Halobellus salinus TaxID=931585 RepID=A0A830ELK7_9EURY|nr:hypothetical protein GCM10008995_01830 [Halobellus salinus]